MPRMITHPACLLDQMDYPVRRPQAGFIPQRLRPAFESILDLVDLRRTQSRLASGAAGLLQPSTPLGKQLGRPLTHRLPVRAHSAQLPTGSGLLQVDSPRAGGAAPVLRSPCLPLLEIPFLQLNT